jgi:SagB-type dehydrogenase family enzyme
MRWFGTWRELESIDPELLPIARQLAEAGVLIEEDTPAHHTESHVMANWQGWYAGAHLHYSTRTELGHRYLVPDEEMEATRRKAERYPPPPLLKSYPDSALVPVPEGLPDDGRWPRNRLLDALYSRRSIRQMADLPISLEELGAILQVAAGVVKQPVDPLLGPAIFKTSPSAGARNPVELYVHARRVDGLKEGLHHFAPSRSGLEEIGPPLCHDDLLEAVGGQQFLAEAPVLLLYTAVLERTQWRYEGSRGYRDILIGLGHVSQTVLLTATGLGLASVFATALCDAALETQLGCSSGEIVLGVTAIGRCVTDRRAVAD